MEKSQIELGRQAETRNVFKKDKRRWIKTGKKYNTRLSTCT